MRARNLKPGFFKNEVLASLQPATRLLFSGLWLLADRKGRLEDRPLRIKGELFPYDDWNIDVLLEDLNQNGFIKRYSASSEKYIQILNFEKHQTPHWQEKDSTIPSLGSIQDKPKRKPRTIQEKSSNYRADSLIPSSLNPDSLLTSLFEIFWKAYPKKKNKGQAEKVWEKIKPTKELTDSMLKKIEQLKKTNDWIKDGGQYIPFPATWLNAKGWEDEINSEISPTDPQDLRMWEIEQLRKKENEKHI